MAIKLEMGSLGHISLDGSKFKANSSKHKAMSYGRLKAKESKLNSYSVCTNLEENIFQLSRGNSGFNGKTIPEYRLARARYLDLY